MNKKNSKIDSFHFSLKINFKTKESTYSKSHILNGYDSVLYAFNTSIFLHLHWNVWGNSGDDPDCMAREVSR